MCAGVRARAGVLLVSTLCVCRGQGYGWSIPSEFCVCVCAGARAMAGVLLGRTLCVCVCWGHG